MPLPQTPRISIKYSITVKVKRDREGKGDRWRGGRIKSMYPCDSIKTTISQFLIENQVTGSLVHTFNS